MKELTEKPSREFLERQRIILLEKENILLKHQLKMEELDGERTNAKLIHEQILERGRINRAEQRKTMRLKQEAQFQE